MLRNIYIFLIFKIIFSLVLTKTDKTDDQLECMVDLLGRKGNLEKGTGCKDFGISA